MKGAVHGEAMTTTSTPEPNASIVRFFDDQLATPEGTNWPNSKTPERLSASTKKRIGHRGHHRRRLQLEAPAELFACGTQRGEHQAEGDECHHHAGSKGDGLPPH
jgi:hypothetical protein